MNIRRFLPALAILVIAGALIWRANTQKDHDPGVFSGYAEGEYVYVASPLGGQLDDLKVQRGDAVETGQPLYVLEREEERAHRDEAAENLRVSRANLDKAQADYTRSQSLNQKRVISPEAFDAAQQALLGAQHTTAAQQQALEQAEWRYSQKAKSAPKAGLVYDTYYRPGEWVAPGTPVLSLLPPEYVKVRFFVPETQLGTFHAGQTVEVRTDGQKDPLRGTVSFISPSAEYTLPIIYSRENRHKLVFLVEASLSPNDAKRLSPGAPVEVRRLPEGK